ncbi:MAG: Thiamine-phosphate synthase [Firmicutes bacterium]|nr:Thiamine-phosphate synthase [Bacillota bacterium]
MPRTEDYSLYLVTDAELIGARDFLSCVRAAIGGGVSMVQLREKNRTAREFYHLAQTVQETTSALDVPLIINDRLDIALAMDADGVHLGQNDLPAGVARHLLGAGKILGISVATMPEAVAAARQGASYVGVGAVFPTATKGNVRAVTLAQLAAIKQVLAIPVLAIGGITVLNAPEVLRTGVDGICVAKAILGEENIMQAASQLRKLLPHKEEEI